MSEKETEQETEEVGEETTDGTEDDRTESETTKILKAQSERIKELEKERNERTLADAKKQLGGRAEAGSKSSKKKEETPHEYRLRIEKELAEGKFEE